MSNAPGQPKSWRGVVAQAIFQPAHHRWQARDASPERSVIKSQERSLRVRLAVLTAMSIGMLGAFLAVLLWGPSKTPLLSVAATHYAWPLPPNAWAYEDVQGLAVLHDKNVDWRDASAAWQSSRQALNDLRLQLQAAEPLAVRAGALVLYLSMHGAVDGSSQPCLLPAGSSALSPEEWIQLGDIVGMVSKSDAFHTLLVLDCVDEQVNWHAGVVQATFAERVIDWAQEHELGNCSILLSAAPQQCSWSGPELRGSIFGQELRLGLCGAADSAQRNQPDPTIARSPYPKVRGVSQGGNQDGIVSLHELTNYLQQRVRAWAGAHRQQEQTPLLISALSHDVPLARALSSSELRKLEAAAGSSQIAVATPSLDEMASLWRMLEALRKRESYRFEPRAWADLEHQLLWLDKLSLAGKAYADQASLKLYPELKKRLQHSIEAAAQADMKDSLVARSKILTNVPVWRLDDAPLPSLAWMDLAMERAPCDTGALRAQLLETLAASTAQGPTIQTLMTGHGLASNRPIPNELNFAGLIQKSGCMSLWPDQSLPRQVLQLRDKCERLAVLGDVRGHRLRRASMRPLDQARRALEDELFLGARPSTPFTQQLNQANALVEAAEGSQRAIERLLAIRDRGLAEASYLAAWLCAPGNDMRNLGDWLAQEGAQPLIDEVASGSAARDKLDPQLRERIARQRLERLIDNLKTLSGLIQQTPVQQDDGIRKLAELADQTAQDLESLHLLVREHVQRALNASASQTANLAQLHELLQLPFLTANDRLSLHKKAEEHLQFQPEQAGDATASTTAAWIFSVQKKVTRQLESRAPELESLSAIGDMGRYSYRLQQWPVHPLAKLLGMKTAGFSLAVPATTSQSKSAVTLESQLDALNERLRTHYLAVASFAARSISAWAKDSALELDESQLNNDWSRVALAASVERMHLPLCPVRPESDACALFIGRALKDMLAWYAERTLQDFYADGRVANGSVTASAFFDQTIHHLLQTAELLPTVDGRADDYQELMRWQEILRTFARSGLRASVKPGIPNPASKQVTYDVNLQPTLALSTDSIASSFWPSGLAGAWLQSDQGSISVSREAIALPLRDGGSTTVLATDSVKREGNSDALVWFRGHTYRAPLHLGQGIVVDFQPQRYDWSEVVLFGDRLQQPSIVLILDCSWSMGEPLPVESLGTETQSRLDLAKLHVLKLIEELSQAQDTRLGVRLFGHRLGWSRPVDPKTGLAKGASQVIPQPNYPRSIPDDVVPSRDVEAMIPLGRFTPEMIGPLSKNLASIVPWGQSPLYLSIMEAFKDFGADSQTTTKSIVVITDGDNFQFNASGRPGGDGGAQTSMEDVLAAWQANKVPLYILGVGVSSQADASGSQGRARLKSLAERTGGKYYDIDSGGDLLRALAEQTSSSSYEIRQLSGRRRSSGDEAESMHQLNENVQLKLSSSEDKYQIAFQSMVKDFSLQGGEALEMMVSEGGQDIVARPYDVQSPRSGVLSRDGQASLTVRVHRPQTQAGGVLFPISFQMPHEHYTPRPTETWIEILPLSADGQALRQTYLYYDVNYDAKTPVPRQSWLASDWPQNSTAAEVRVWARYDRSPVTAAIDLSELRTDPQRWAAGAAVPGIPEVSLRMVGQAASGGERTWSLQVTELHSQQSRGIGSLKIQVDSGSGVQPLRVTRRFDAESRMAIHTFEFTQAASEQLISGRGKLTLTTRHSALDQAYQLQGGQAIRVDFVRSLELLPLPLPASP